MFGVRPMCISKSDGVGCKNIVSKPGERCESCYQKIVSDGSVASRIALAQEGGLPKYARKALAQDPLVTVRAVFAARPDITKEEESSILTLADEMLERALANNPYVSMDTLRKLRDTTKDPLTASIIARRFNN